VRGYFGYIWDADGRQLAFVKDGVLYGAEGRIGTITTMDRCVLSISDSTVNIWRH
jgi:hypothetical protein